MRLVRFGAVGREKPGLLDGRGNVRDLSGIVNDIDGATLQTDSLQRLAGIDPTTLPAVPSTERLGACVARPGKFICIGLNYADHVRESGAETPTEPVVFMKATSALSGPDDPIIQPKHSTKLDWEVELALVIGEECRYVDESRAQGAIAGYCVCNDVSERAFQLERGGLWDKGKGCDSFGPIGPWLVTADEIPDPCDLAMRLWVNGVRYQNGSSREMIFKPAYLVSYLSHFMSLQPGDIVSTGTPPGVGLGQKPPVYLRPGDVVKLEIEHLGKQTQQVIPWDSPRRP